MKSLTKKTNTANIKVLNVKEDKKVVAQCCAKKSKIISGCHD